MCLPSEPQFLNNAAQSTSGPCTVKISGPPPPSFSSLGLFTDIIAHGFSTLSFGSKMGVKVHGVCGASGIGRCRTNRSTPSTAASTRSLIYSLSFQFFITKMGYQVGAIYTLSFKHIPYLYYI
jgi:hypothetical protein